MKKLSLVIAALAMMLGITQCKKQENPVGGKLITQKVTFTTSFGDGSKLDQEGIVDDGGNLSLRWEVGDKITVTDDAATPNVSTLECKSVSNNGLTGTFEGTITCIENATLTFGAGTKPDYTDQHVTDIKKAVYLECSHEYVQSGDYELELAMPYAILKVDLAEFATPEGTNVSVKINDETDLVPVVTGVKTDACQVYLLLPLAVTDPTETILTFTAGDKTITKTYTLASHGFYTGGGNGGYAPIMKDYLCFTAVEAGSSVSMKINGSLPDLAEALETSTDGKTWTAFTPGTTTITLANIGDKVYFRRKGEEAATSFSTSYNDYAYFVMTGKIAASGNVMSLIDPDCKATEIPCDKCFYMLFRFCSSLTAAPTLPATSLKDACYCCMFIGCRSLTAAPELPATNLADYCYSSMFQDCTSLTAVPNLPATTLAANCYNNMFGGCSKLTAAPELPATTLAANCYDGMFQYCGSLTAAPALNATNLADYCYAQMFLECSSLTAAPELPATNLKEACYYSMFFECSSLNAAPELPATTLVKSCYEDMFNGCSSLTAAPELPATTLVESCYEDMFIGCSNLQDITVRFTQWDESSTMMWVLGVPTGGTFHCPSDLSHEDFDYGDDFIPTGWTVDATL